RSPCETPCETSTVCSTGAGPLFAPPIRFGSGPPFPAGAIAAILGAGASLDGAAFSATGCEPPFLMTMGCAATSDAAGLDEPDPELALLGRSCLFTLLGAASTGEESSAVSVVGSATPAPGFAGAPEAGADVAEDSVPGCGTGVLGAG